MLCLGFLPSSKVSNCCAPIATIEQILECVGLAGLAALWPTFVAGCVEWQRGTGQSGAGPPHSKVRRLAKEQNLISTKFRRRISCGSRFKLSERLNRKPLIHRLRLVATRNRPKRRRAD